ncbi:MAG: sialidase family protein [Candidatus Solibacter sp.]
MRSTKWLSLVFILFTGVFICNERVAGQQPATDLPVNLTTAYKGEEFLLIGDAVRGGGEPVIAINPKNPNNIIVGAMANNHYVEGAPLGTGTQRITVEARVKYRNTPGSSISRFAISSDRGRTWRFIDDPFRDAFKMNGTADAFVGVGKDGALFIGAMNFFPLNATPEMLELEKEPRPGLLFGATDLAWSSDEGKTWSAPVHVMGQANKQQDYGPGLKPEFLGKTPYDRPFLITDLSTGTIYIPGNGSGGEPPHRETFFRASRDNGKNWGPIYAYDSAEYPQGGGAGRPAAANGVFGVAYMAASVPPGAAAKCPCIIFGASRDEGKTFERHVVQAELPPQQGFGGMGNLAVAADASHPGRFAIMTLTAGNTEMNVLVTEDYGKTWKAPVKAGGTPGATISKPDMSYSPRGDLAVMWLAVQPDLSYSMWSAASRDGGMKFSQPVQVSHGASPPRSSIKYRGNNWDGDDLSSLAVDNDFVHIVWADGRAGFLGAWYARVPLSSY